MRKPVNTLMLIFACLVTHIILLNLPDLFGNMFAMILGRLCISKFIISNNTTTFVFIQSMIDIEVRTFEIIRLINIQQLITLSVLHNYF